MHDQDLNLVSGKVSKYLSNFFKYNKLNLIVFLRVVGNFSK